MATLFAANESTVMVDGEAVEGVQSIEYRQQAVRRNLYAVGGAERIGVISGPQAVEGRIRVASTTSTLDGRIGNETFQISSQLRHGDTTMTVSFDDCLLTAKTFEMSVGNHGEAVYSFTATRVREERG
ncbi:MAG: hypothetical protein G3M70_05145 [Candidatus Nitronauta litoralis]|uniref:Uncharacterized protein n=1 Tax=Candidatus Nitronauta litoralis TaxID=2705533 RepID=A0A7T0FZX3_9BACT|nr:MAG: hypothetical protein G3M70_05145 [Candidatus Nitronauta litoralis]